MSKKITVNVVSESEVSVQGHGVHTAYVEMVNALKAHSDIEVITGRFNEQLECDVVHFHTVGTRVWKKLRQKGVKKVISAHVVPDSFVGSLIGARYWKGIASRYLKWFYNRGDVVLAVSDETKRDLIKLGVNVPIEVFYNFIDTSVYKKHDKKKASLLREKLSIPSDAFVVVGCGQVQPRKRIDSFIKVAQRLPDVHFVWVGGMPFKQLAAEYRDMKHAMENAPANVHFPGIAKLEDMPVYYTMSDAFFLPSDQETFGLVVIEAAAAGLPILLRDIPDYKETFAEFALSEKTEEAFAANIRKLQSSKKLYATMQQQAIALAERFDSRQASERLVQLYRELCYNKK